MKSMLSVDMRCLAIDCGHPILADSVSASGVTPPPPPEGERFRRNARRSGRVRPGMADPFDLDRFLDAQRDTYDQALAEIRAGRKRSHWMWFVFPQIAGLGHSTMAQHYAIRSLGEAEAYLAHPALGARLREMVAALRDVLVPDAEAMFGGIDAVKLRSSLTLFEAAGGGTAFGEVLDRWFGGTRDPATLARI